ncbi:MAG: hypothetical protein HYS27_23295 [Deltaproteobacteria bacterium]|nr:hypothetical protein [Deltaproteobacteria bacterium]
MLGVIAAALCALAPPAAALVVLPRPEVPWLVAVAAPQAAAAAAAERRALEEAGGHVATSSVDGVLLVSAEGPPEAEALVLAAVRALAPGAPVFLEGRATATSSGALPPPRGAPRLRARAAPGDGPRWALPLPFSPWLLDDDGEVLRLLVARELARKGAFSVAFALDGQGARLIITAEGARSTGDELVGLLRELAGRPLTPRAVEVLRGDAAALRARRGARVGVGARRAAVRCRWFGNVPDTMDDELGVRLRAALVPETLRAEAGAPRPP